MALALDEPTEDDERTELDGFTFCINKELSAQVGGVTIDLNYMGFSVEPEIPLAGGKSSCGSCAGSCGA